MRPGASQGGANRLLDDGAPSSPSSSSPLPHSFLFTYCAEGCMRGCVRAHQLRSFPCGGAREGGLRLLCGRRLAARERLRVRLGAARRRAAHEHREQAEPLARQVLRRGALSEAWASLRVPRTQSHRSRACTVALVAQHTVALALALFAADVHRLARAAAAWRTTGGGRRARRTRRSGRRRAPRRAYAAIAWPEPHRTAPSRRLAAPSPHRTAAPHRHAASPPPLHRQVRRAAHADGDEPNLPRRGGGLAPRLLQGARGAAQCVKLSAAQ